MPCDALAAARRCACPCLCLCGQVWTIAARQQMLRDLFPNQFTLLDWLYIQQYALALAIVILAYLYYFQLSGLLVRTQFLPVRLLYLPVVTLTGCIIAVAVLLIRWGYAVDF